MTMTILKRFLTAGVFFTGTVFAVTHLVTPAVAQDHLAQEIKLPPNIEKLSATAKETAEVNMDGAMLHWASKFLSSSDPDDVQTAKVVANLKSIYVRNFEFDHDGGYSAADVESLRTLMNLPEWHKVVGVRSETGGENVDVYFKLENEKMAGIVVISAEPRELTFVNITGPIDLDQLANLGGEFGVPKMKLKGVKVATKAQKQDETGGQK